MKIFVISLFRLYDSSHEFILKKNDSSLSQIRRLVNLFIDVFVSSYKSSSTFSSLVSSYSTSQFDSLYSTNQLIITSRFNRSFDDSIRSNVNHFFSNNVEKLSKIQDHTAKLFHVSRDNLESRDREKNRSFFFSSRWFDEETRRQLSSRRYRSTFDQINLSLSFYQMQENLFDLFNKQVKQLDSFVFDQSISSRNENTSHITQSREARQKFISQMIEQLRDIMREKIQQIANTSKEYNFITNSNSYSSNEFEIVVNRFKAIDLDFFHFDVFESYESNDITFVHKKTIYREVFTFVQRLNDYAHVINESVVRENLFFCFRDATMTWYLKEIDDFKRKTFRSVSLVEFIDELKARFKMRINKILDKLIAKIFIVKNAKENREATSFLQNIILYAQSTNIFDLQKQFIWAWQQLNVDLRTMMIMSTINTSIQDFIEELKIKRDLWKTILTRRFTFSNRSTNKANKRVEKHRFTSQQQRQHSSYTFYSSRATYVVSYSQYINYSSRQSMQNLNNYNDQFCQAVSSQQVSLQNITFQKRLIITDSTIDNSIDIENRNFFY